MTSNKSHKVYNPITSMLFLLCCSLALAQVQESKTAHLMGSVFQITLVDQDSATAHLNINRVITEIERIENLISEWRPHTQIAEVNHNAGIKAVKVDREVFKLTERALRFSKISHGAFDISIAAMDNLWVFDGTMERLPSKRALRESVKKVNYNDIILDSVHSTIFLKERGMKIGFGSVGKGYAADKGRALMQGLGIKGGIVNASGDIASWGTRLNGKPWRIGVNNPFETGEQLEVLEFSQNNGVATSGSYEKYAEIYGKRYAHIINPKTGFPSTGLTSVTIIGQSAEMCNGFSTAIMVLGAKKGIKLLKKYPEYQYIMLTDTGDVIKAF